MIESEGHWPGLAKVIEETSELNVNLAKLMANNGNTNYWGDVDLIAAIEEELGDALAAIEYFVEANQHRISDDAVDDRRIMKKNRFRQWAADPEIRNLPQEKHYV
jgi:hypothetical protein